MYSIPHSVHITRLQIVCAFNRSRNICICFVFVVYTMHVYFIMTVSILLTFFYQILINTIVGFQE